MKECDKRNSHISGKLNMIYISSNNVRHPVTTLQYTSPNYVSLHFTTLFDASLPLNKLHPPTIHYPLTWLNPISISYRVTSHHVSVKQGNY